jgi:hypothetical protein
MKKLCEELCEAQILFRVQDRLTLAAEGHSEAGGEDVEEVAGSSVFFLAYMVSKGP